MLEGPAGSGAAGFLLVTTFGPLVALEAVFPLVGVLLAAGFPATGRATPLPLSAVRARLLTERVIRRCIVSENPESHQRQTYGGYPYRHLTPIIILFRLKLGVLLSIVIVLRLIVGVRARKLLGQVRGAVRRCHDLWRTQTWDREGGRPDSRQELKRRRPASEQRRKQVSRVMQC